MKLATKIVGVALTATALCCVGVGTASAATPAGSHSVSAAANTIDAPTTTVVAYQGGISWMQSVDLRYFFCPSDYPWLVNVELSPGQRVPNGVKVDEPGSVSVMITDPYAGPGGLVSGWTSGTATNWERYDAVTVSAVCTSSADAGLARPDSTLGPHLLGAATRVVVSPCQRLLILVSPVLIMLGGGRQAGVLGRSAAPPGASVRAGRPRAWVEPQPATKIMSGTQVDHGR